MISQRQMAKALGVSKRTVEKRAAQGMPMNSLEAARSWCGGNLGEPRGSGVVATSGSHGIRRIKAPPPIGPASIGPAPDDPGGELEDLNQLDQKTLDRLLTAARVKLTERDTAIRRLQEKQRQVDADLRDGKLLRSEDVYRRAFELAVTARTKLLGIPSECAVQLAAMPDPAMVADFLRKRIKAALIEYCSAYGVSLDEPG